MRLLLGGLLAVASFFGQGGESPLSGLLALVRDSLTLTETQVQQNAEFEEWVSLRYERMAPAETLKLVDTGAQAEAFLLMPNWCRDAAATATDSVVHDPLNGIRYGNVWAPSVQRTGGFARVR